MVFTLFYLGLWYPHILCKNKFISNSAQTCILRKSFKKWFKLRLKFVQNLTSLFLLMSLYSMTTIIGKYMVYCRNKVFFLIDFNVLKVKRWRWSCLKFSFLKKNLKNQFYEIKFIKITYMRCKKGAWFVILDVVPFHFFL